MFICAWVCLRRGWAEGGGEAKDIYVSASVTLNAFLPNQLTSLTKKVLLRYHVKVMEITLFLYIKVLNNLHIYILWYSPSTPKSWYFHGACYSKCQKKKTHTILQLVKHKTKKVLKSRLPLSIGQTHFSSLEDWINTILCITI